MMIRKNYYFFVFLGLLVFTIYQPVFAGFSVTIINNSNIVYKSVDFITSAVGFDAPYGRITINTEKINPGELEIFHYGYKYLEIPLSGTDMPSVGCNLNVSIIANPKDVWRTVMSGQFDNILKENPQTIWEDEPRAFPTRSRLAGIKPPSVEITLTKEKIEFKSS